MVRRVYAWPNLSERKVRPGLTEGSKKDFTDITRTMTEENLTLVRKDLRLSYGALEGALKIGSSSVLTILHEQLRLGKVSYR